MTSPHHAPTLSQRLAPFGLVALALLGACRSSGGEQRSTVAELLEHQAWDEAYREAVLRAEEAPDDERAAADLERARVAYCIDHGRQLALHGEVEDALALFEELERQGAAPDQVAQWLTKCRRMLSEERRVDGWELELQGDFDGASTRYREAVAYWPQDEFAKSGLERIDMLAAWRRDQRKSYYDSGTRELRNFQLPEARRSFEAALKFAPEDPDAARRVAEVRQTQAEERLALAVQLGEEGRFHAAATELRIAKELVPSFPNIDALIAIAELEISVSDTLGDAERLVRRGSTDEAIALIEAQLARTRLQTATVTAALLEARERRLEERYEAALALERDFDFPAAVAAYDALIEAAGGFYNDALARRDTLSSYIGLAAELYAEYEAAGDDAGRLAALRKLDLFWPTYRDVWERLIELRAKVPQTN
jgi:tetratricopeptide (TPR) repeat protein